MLAKIKSVVFAFNSQQAKLVTVTKVFHSSFPLYEKHVNQRNGELKNGASWKQKIFFTTGYIADVGTF
jgi:hypothetical protein